VLQPGMLGAAFKVYWEDMDKCRTAKAFWSLLHVTVCLPDICAALQSKNGGATPALYESWCEQHLPDPMFTGEERYRMRCKVLHQGYAKTERPGRYSGFAFGQPSDTGSIEHKRVANGVLHLDVGELASEVKAAVEKWIRYLEGNQHSKETTAAEKNLGSLVRVSLVTFTVPPMSGQTSTYNKTH
jgi:hypothetical protein